MLEAIKNDVTFLNQTSRPSVRLRTEKITSVLVAIWLLQRIHATMKAATATREI